MMLAYEDTNVYLHEVSLHMEHSLATSSVSPGRETQYSSQRRISLLLSCLEATKSFLDCFLRTPPELIVRHSTMEKGQLAHAMTVLIKIAFCKNLGLDNFPLREACNVSRQNILAVQVRTYPMMDTQTLSQCSRPRLSASRAGTRARSSLSRWVRPQT